MGVDRYDAYGTLALAERQGIPMQPLRQGSGLAHGIKLVEQQIIDRGITHNGDPLARWCFQNAEVKYNNEGWAYLVRPSDRRSSKIIDPAIAAVMAGDRIIHLQNEAAKVREYGIGYKEYEEEEKREDLGNDALRNDAEPSAIIDWNELEEL